MAVKAPRKAPVRRRAKLDRPNPIDLHVGGRVRLRRMILGLSQERLGDKIGLTFQQVQKYERGANRIGASRLWELAQVLDVPVQFFFGEMTDQTVDQMRAIATATSGAGGGTAYGLAEDPADSYGVDPLARREVLELVRAYCRITDPNLRHRLFELTKTLATTPEPETNSTKKLG